MSAFLEVLVWNPGNYQDILVAFSTRRGGMSALPVSGLNLGFHVGDRRHFVLNNRFKLLHALGLHPDSMVMGEQIHGAHVRVVDGQHAGRGAWCHKEALPHTDAMVTSTAGLVLAGCYADCVPVFIMDLAQRAIALVHAGWKGTAAHIAVKTYQIMRQFFVSKPEDCVAVIGPAIGPCCYQVDELVRRAMRSRWWWQSIHSCEGNFYRVDLALANQLQLESLGITTQNSSICTSCDQRFYSHRRDGDQTGRMLGLVSIRQDAGNGCLPRE